MAKPFADSIAGEWPDAAASSREIGCHEAALALADTGDEKALRQALVELQALGASPAGQIAGRKAARAGRPPSAAQASTSDA